MLGSILLQWLKQFLSCHHLPPVVAVAQITHKNRKLALATSATTPRLTLKCPPSHKYMVLFLMFLYNMISAVMVQLNSEYNLQSYSAARLAKQLLLFVFQLCLRSLGRKPVSCICAVIGWSPTNFLYNSDLYRYILIKSIVMLLH